MEPTGRERIETIAQHVSERFAEHSRAGTHSNDNVRQLDDAMDLCRDYLSDFMNDEQIGAALLFCAYQISVSRHSHHETPEEVETCISDSIASVGVMLYQEGKITSGDQ